MTTSERSSQDDDKRGGYSGSVEADRVPPPTKVPSASVRQPKRRFQADAA